MSALAPLAPFLPVPLAFAAALLLRAMHARRPGLTGGATALLGWFALAPLAWIVATPADVTLARAALAGALAIAVLARDREDIAHGECALKLAWALGAALALTWAGESLLAIAAGSAVGREQWPALALQLDPYALWTSALALTLLAGVVLLGGAPFHFWVGDVLQGARAWQAPLLVAALQAAGAALLVRRLDGIAAFPQGALLVRGTLALAAGLALVGGAATLTGQRRPERRVGTLASLQGGLVLAALAAEPGRMPFAQAGASLGTWAAHLALALTGAGALARFMPVDGRPDLPGAVLFRRHRASAVLGAWALLSLAGAPFTPGAGLWLGVARSLAAGHQMALLAALALAWIVGVTAAADSLRRAFGSPSAEAAPSQAVPWPARAALWCAAAGMVWLGVRMLRG
jgi:NADH:ubiquinone oxidoreductase subunit 2 (subunit N)